MSNKYMNFLLKRECYRDIVLIDHRIFPNVKEVSESVGLYFTLSHVIKADMKKPLRIVCVGDGKYGRTGLLFAMMTKWNVWSVDPELVVKDKPEFFRSVDRYTAVAEKIESLTGASLNDMNDCDVMVACHSHANLRVSKKMLNPKIIVSMPCCEPDHLNEICVSYRDLNILSPKNTINIYGIDQKSIKYGV